MWGAVEEEEKESEALEERAAVAQGQGKTAAAQDKGRVVQHRRVRFAFIHCLYFLLLNVDIFRANKATNASSLTNSFSLLEQSDKPAVRIVAVAQRKAAAEKSLGAKQELLTVRFVIMK